MDPKPPPAPTAETSVGGKRKMYTSPPGSARARECAKEFREHLSSIARKLARRRGSSTIDETDVSNAYQHISQHRRRPLWQDISASAIVIAGASSTAYAFNLASREQPPAGCYVLTASGIVVGVLGECFRHWDFK